MDNIEKLKLVLGDYDCFDSDGLEVEFDFYEDGDDEKRKDEIGISVGVHSYWFRQENLQKELSELGCVFFEKRFGVDFDHIHDYDEQPEKIYRRFFGRYMASLQPMLVLLLVWLLDLSQVNIQKRRLVKS